MIDMERKLTKAELEAQLSGKQADIEARLDALKDEMTSAGEDVQKFVVSRPQMIAGGALVAGLVLGWYITGRRRRRRKRVMARSHNALVEHYMDALSGVVRMELSSGKNIDEAIRMAMANHLPLIIVEPGDMADREESGGVVKDTFSFLLKTALGFASKVLIDQVQARLNLDQQIEGFLGSISGPPEPTSFASDSSDVAPAPISEY